MLSPLFVKRGLQARPAADWTGLETPPHKFSAKAYLTASLDIGAVRAYASMVRIISIVCIWLAAGSLSVVDPVYPPNAVGRGTVVAQLRMSAGAVKSVTILSGEEPFSSSCKSALAQWRLPAGQDGDELVVVHFRRPELNYAGDSGQRISPAKPIESMAYPEYVVTPAYPANALGQGGVVLRTDISAEGWVVDVRVVKSMGILTDASVDAVKKWKFVPARDSHGNKTPAHAYTVLVFRFPTIAD